MVMVLAITVTEVLNEVEKSSSDGVITVVDKSGVDSDHHPCVTHWASPAQC